MPLRTLALSTGLLFMTVVSLAAAAADAREARLLNTSNGSSADWDWRVVNDNVMGGRSDGDFVIDGQSLRFTGSTNTNGGGFSSIRADGLDFDLSNFEGVRLRVKGDGRRYTWRLETEALWRSQRIGYWADFDTVDGEWNTVDIPFAHFVPRVRGNQLRGPELDTRNIRGMGLMIYDGQDGPFTIEVGRVQLFGPRNRLNWPTTAGENACWLSAHRRPTTDGSKRSSRP